ncbi:hypothetical protein [Lampropedia aestuarii]|uniref:hypothetical protein n=1 Tax=Lampropedia aestuarii TaxID=2562762 RepID=UPI001F0ED3E7|nr:hypothetical protein [Lampropedia aestuarii]MDH5858223.1 hypothetical protein [Lampropedia aestuarii]
MAALFAAGFLSLVTVCDLVAVFTAFPAAALLGAAFLLALLEAAEAFFTELDCVVAAPFVAAALVDSLSRVLRVVAAEGVSDLAGAEVFLLVAIMQSHR